MNNAAKTNVYVYVDFLDKIGKLSEEVRDSVSKCVKRLLENPESSGLHKHKLKGYDNIYACSAGGNYRLVMECVGDAYYVFDCGTHDVYNKNLSDRNNQGRPARRVMSGDPDGVLSDVSSLLTTEQIIEESGDGFGYFDRLSKRQLLSIGVREEQIALVRSLSTVEQLEESQKNFSNATFKALYSYAVDCPRSYDQALWQFRFSNDFHNPEFFHKILGDEDWDAMMEYPLEKWRIFLHKSQKDIVDRDYNGSAKVLGSAGTGKTVLAMHRAKRLASKCADGEKILFTMFNKNLVSDVRENLKKICSEGELDKIDVININAWLERYLEEIGCDFSIFYYDAKKDDIWQCAVQQSPNDLGFSPEVYANEWERVVVAQEAFTREQYLTVIRTGMGTILDRKRRMAIWSVFEKYRELMRERHIRDVGSAMYECQKRLGQGEVKPIYKHAIVDEGQDFGNSAYRLIRALVGKEHQNDIFIVGDAHQRIYKNKVVLSRCGIDVRGNSSTLEVNYRTTEEIQKYALSLLSDISFDDLDGGVDTGSICQSLNTGVAPTIGFYASQDDEMLFVASKIEELQKSGVPLNNICVVARNNDAVNDCMVKLESYDITAYKIEKEDDRKCDGVRFATMHRVKGLEFAYIFAVSVNRGVVPPVGVEKIPDPVIKKEAVIREKCLLYVALTRAKLGTYITGYGEKSELLR